MSSDLLGSRTILITTRPTVPVNKEFTFRFKRTIVLRCKSSRSVTVFLSSFLSSVFIGIICTYIRTVYTHVTKHQAALPNRSSFKCESEDSFYLLQQAKDPGTHYGKGYKAARRYSSDLKLLRSLSPNGFR